MAPNDVTARIAAGGRIVIPADFRRELGLEIGDEVIIRLANGEVHVLSRSQAINKAQALVRTHVGRNRSLVKELIRERRRESKRE